MTQSSPEFSRMDNVEYDLLESGPIDALNELRRRQGQGFRVETETSIWRVQPNPGHSTFETLKRELKPGVLADFTFLWNQFFRTERSSALEHPSIRPVDREFNIIFPVEEYKEGGFTGDITDHPQIVSDYLDELNAAVEEVGRALRNGLWVASLRLGEVDMQADVQKVIRLGQVTQFVKTVDVPGDLRIEPLIKLDDESLLLPDDAVLQGVAIKP